MSIFLIPNTHIESICIFVSCSCCEKLVQLMRTHLCWDFEEREKTANNGWREKRWRRKNLEKQTNQQWRVSVSERFVRLGYWFCSKQIAIDVYLWFDVVVIAVFSTFYNVLLRLEEWMYAELNYETQTAESKTKRVKNSSSCNECEPAKCVYKHVYGIAGFNKIDRPSWKWAHLHIKQQQQRP